MRITMMISLLPVEVVVVVKVVVVVVAEVATAAAPLVVVVFASILRFVCRLSKLPTHS